MTNRIAADCVPHFLFRTKILNVNPFESGANKDIDFLTALDTSTPRCIYPGFELTEKIMIRSLLSGDVKR